MASDAAASDGGQRPVPDPTVLTTEALQREIKALKELLEMRTNGVTNLMLEKFRSVDEQLSLVERQRVEQKADTKAAVDAALTAQKEAVKEQTTASATAIAKSESGTSEQLKQLSTSFTTAFESQRREFSDLKERVGSIEAMKLGGQESRAGLYAAAAFISSLIVVGLAVVGFIAANPP